MEAGVKAQAETVTAEEDKPLSAEERRQQQLENWFNSDWTEELEAQQAQAEEEREAAVCASELGSGVGEGSQRSRERNSHNFQRIIKNNSEQHATANQINPMAKAKPPI